MFTHTSTSTATLKALARRFNDRRQARQTLFAFSRLDDHVLKDIGVRRCELPHAAGHPLFRRCSR